VGELIHQELERHAVLRLKLTAVAKAPIKPEMVDPSLAIVMKISPGAPSSYMPTVM
jgi:hypothetical protein